jgi:hypothetical protein
MDSNEFNGAFWLTITGVLTAFISGALVYAVKSKCSKCNICFGLINIERNVEIEEKIEEIELERGISRDDTKR